MGQCVALPLPLQIQSIFVSVVQEGASASLLNSRSLLAVSSAGIVGRCFSCDGGKIRNEISYYISDVLLSDLLKICIAFLPLPHLSNLAQSFIFKILPTSFPFSFTSLC